MLCTIKTCIRRTQAVLRLLSMSCLMCMSCDAGERVDSINHYAGTIRKLETQILKTKKKILAVQP